MGKPKDPHYWRKWRAAHPEYQARERQRLRSQTRNHHTAGERRKSRAIDREPLPPLFPELHHGAALSWWDEELRLDLKQEAELALLEGRDPVLAVRQYASREVAWYRATRELDSVLGQKLSMSAARAVASSEHWE